MQLLYLTVTESQEHHTDCGKTQRLQCYIKQPFVHIQLICIAVSVTSEHYYSYQNTPFERTIYFTQHKDTVYSTLSTQRDPFIVPPDNVLLKYFTFFLQYFFKVTEAVAESFVVKQSAISGAAQQNIQNNGKFSTPRYSAGQNKT